MNQLRRPWPTPGVIGSLPPEVRDPLLTTNLWIAGLGGFAVLVLSVGGRVSLEMLRHPVFILLFVLHSSVIGLAVWRSGPFLLRTLGLGILCLAWAAILLAYIGPAGLVALFLVLCTLIGGSLYGIRGFVAAFAGVIVLYAASAYGWSRGYLPLAGSFTPDYRSVSYWGLNLVSFLTAAFMIAALVHFLLHRTSHLLVEEVRMAGSLAREQRLRAEAELTRLREEIARHEAEATLAAMLRGAPIGIALVKDGRLETVNDRMCQMFGCDAAEIARQPLASLFVDPEGGGTLARELPLRFGEGQLMALECATRTRGGALLWLSITAIPLDPAQPEMGMVATFADITGLRRSAEMLREREQRLREIFDHTSEVIYSVLVSAEGGFVIERVNRAAARYGIDVAAVNACGRAPRDLFPDDVAAGIEHDFQACVAARTSLRMQRALNTPAGTVHFATTLVPILAPDSSRVVRLMGLARDITAEVRSQELERARAGAEAANRAKSAFLSHMSHEIRTPLNAILGFTRLVRRQVEHSAGQAEALEIIHRNGEHLLGLINDILEISTIEAGRVSVREATVVLADLLEDLRSTFAAGAEARGLELRVSIAGECPPTMQADPGRLRQILGNLLDNALKFTSSGRIELHVAPVRGDGQPHLEFAVTDTGPGIAPDEIERLFQPFEQTTAGRQAGGTGLGLAISRGFARLLGGDIVVKSTPGIGSVFRVVLPCPAPAAQPVARAPGAGATLVPGTPRLDGAGLRVLIVDDVADNRAVLVRFLESTGVEVRAVGSTAAAVDLVRAWSPQCAVVDMRLPGEDASVLVAALRAARAPEPLAVIGLSASVFAEDRGTFAASGIDAFLPKPFQDGDMLEAITRLTGAGFSGVVADLVPGTASQGLTPDLRRAIEHAAVESDYVALQGLVATAAVADGELGGRLRARLREFDYEGVRGLVGGKERA